MERLQVKVILLVLAGQAVFANYRFGTGPESYEDGESSVRYTGKSGTEYSSDHDDAIDVLGVVPLDAEGTGYGKTVSNLPGTRDNDAGNRFKRITRLNENPPSPNFSYSLADEEGNTHYRSEQRDPNGNVRGTYGYTNTRGLYRVVEYVADENGYRATIRTNEPGMDGRRHPANVQIVAEEPPPGTYKRPVPTAPPFTTRQPTQPQTTQRPQVRPTKPPREVEENIIRSGTNRRRRPKRADTPTSY